MRTLRWHKISVQKKKGTEKWNTCIIEIAAYTRYKEDFNVLVLDTYTKDKKYGDICTEYLQCGVLLAKF